MRGLLYHRRRRERQRLRVGGQFEPIALAYSNIIRGPSTLTVYRTDTYVARALPIRQSRSFPHPRVNFPVNKPVNKGVRVGM